jgi:hypothetical protein
MASPALAKAIGGCRWLALEDFYMSGTVLSIQLP